MSYSVRKLKFFVDDSDGWLRKNKATTEQYFMAEDDGETKEMLSLLDTRAHCSSFWGLVRGYRAIMALQAQEREHLRITWTTGVIPLTSHTFMRSGYVHVLSGSFGANIPFIGQWISSFFQKEIIESTVVREGKVVFRHLGYRWSLGKYQEWEWGLAIVCLFFGNLTPWTPPVSVH